MAWYADAPATFGNEGRRRFFVSLLITNGSKIRVRSCGVKSGHLQSTTSFSRRMALQGVFALPIATAIQLALSDIPPDASDFRLPELRVEIPGLTLAAADVRASVVDEGRLLTLRFAFVLGSVGLAFRPDLDNACSTLAIVDDSTTQILADVALPLLDLCAAVEAGIAPDADGAAQFAQVLMQRSCEIRFQIELVKRFSERVHALRDASQGSFRTARKERGNAFTLPGDTAAQLDPALT